MGSHIYVLKRAVQETAGIHGMWGRVSAWMENGRWCIVIGIVENGGLVNSWMVESEQKDWTGGGVDFMVRILCQNPSGKPQTSNHMHQKWQSHVQFLAFFVLCVCIIFEHTMPISRTLLSTLTKPPTTPLQTRLESSSVLTAFERTSWIWYCARERGPFYV